MTSNIASRRKLSATVAFLKRKAPGIAIIFMGVFLAYLSLIRFVQDYYCLPESKGDLIFIKGRLVEINKSFRMGDVFVLENSTDTRALHTAMADKLAPFIGDQITVGVADRGLFCSGGVFYLEHAGIVIRDVEISIRNMKKGRWFDFVVFAFLAPLSAICLFGGYRILRRAHPLDSMKRRCES